MRVMEQPRAMSTPHKTGQESVEIELQQRTGSKGFLPLLSAGLFVCFFLPWMRIFIFGKPSGFDSAKEGGAYSLLWALPIFSAITIIAGLAKSGQQLAGVITGVLPFIVLGVGLYHIGPDLFSVLEIGAWAGLALGLATIIAASRLK